MAELRPYQADALRAIVERRKAGVTRQLVVLPTASGKTILAGFLPKVLPLQPGKQMWMLNHTDELIIQSANKLQRLNPDLKVGIEQERLRHDQDCDIVVGSIPTLSRLGERVGRIRVQDVQVVVTDEFHHSASKSWMAVLRLLRVLKGEPDEDVSKLLIGLTATPNRSDNIGLEKICDEIVYSKELRGMVQDGWLCDIRGYRVDTSVDISQVGVRRGDFITRQLEAVVNTEVRNKLIVDKYCELGENKPSIAFTVDVKHSHDLAMEFRKAGINALPVSGKTPDEERQRLLAAHERGDVKVLASCGVYNEGADLPWASVGLLGRPTGSGLLYKQIVGRLLRLYPAPEDGIPVKTQATIIDFVDNSSRHQLCSLPSLFGLPQKMNLSGESLSEIADEVDKLQERSKRPVPEFTDIASLRSFVSAIDLLGLPVIPPELEPISKLMWIKTRSGYEIMLPEYILSIRENALGQYTVSRRSKGVESGHTRHSTLPGAVTFAEAIVPPAERILVTRAVKWRQLGASDKQIRALFRIEKNLASKFPDFAKFHEFVSSTYNRGEVSTMLSTKIALKEGQ